MIDKNDGKIRIPVPKTPPPLTSYYTPRDQAKRYVEIMDFTAMIESSIFGVVQGMLVKSDLPARARTEVSDRIKAAFGAAIEVHRSELQDAFIDEILERYTAAELCALVEFHDSVIGRQLRAKGPATPGAQPTSKVFVKINQLARQLLDDHGASA